MRIHTLLQIGTGLSIALTGMPAFAQAPDTPAPEPTATPAPASAPVTAQRRHRGGGRLLGQLKSILTDEQKEEAQEIMASFRSEAKPLVQEVRSLREAMNAEGADNKTVQDKQARLAELRQQLKAMHKESIKKLIGILTPEQKEQLKEMNDKPAAPESRS
jgi:Spy/CpxP family protein refolding chaperone